MITHLNSTIKRRSPKRDNAVDKVRTIFWFQFLGKHVVRSLRPRDVQRAISPMPAVDALGGIIKNNKFLSYSRGDHVPNAALVRQAAAIHPLSAYILNHVIWEVLRENRSVEENLRLWIGRLAPDIQKILIKQNQLEESSYTLKMLERRFSLDSLAALTILFRLNREDERANEDVRSLHAANAWEYACGIFRVLVMMEPQFLTIELKNYVFQLFVERVFSLVTAFWGTGVRMNFEGYDYPKAAFLFREGAKHLQIHIRQPIKRDDIRHIDRLIKIPLVSTNSN